MPVVDTVPDEVTLTTPGPRFWRLIPRALSPLVKMLPGEVKLTLIGALMGVGPTTAAIPEEPAPAVDRLPETVTAIEAPAVEAGPAKKPNLGPTIAGELLPCVEILPEVVTVTAPPD
jgi:hypothetical protein